MLVSPCAAPVMGMLQRMGAPRGPPKGVVTALPTPYPPTRPYDTQTAERRPIRARTAVCARTGCTASRCCRIGPHGPVRARTAVLRVAPNGRSGILRSAQRSPSYACIGAYVERCVVLHLVPFRMHWRTAAGPSRPRGHRAVHTNAFIQMHSLVRGTIAVPRTSTARHVPCAFMHRHPHSGPLARPIVRPQRRRARVSPRGCRPS
jgi:hypothetical protein